MVTDLVEGHQRFHGGHLLPEVRCFRDQTLDLRLSHYHVQLVHSLHVLQRVVAHRLRALLLVEDGRRNVDGVQRHLATTTTTATNVARVSELFKPLFCLLVTLFRGDERQTAVEDCARENIPLGENGDAAGGD